MQLRHLSGTDSARETLNAFALQDQTTQSIIKEKTWIICDQKGTTKIPVHEKELEREGIEQSDTHTHTYTKEGVKNETFKAIFFGSNRTIRKNKKTKKTRKDEDKVGRTKSE